MLKEDAKINKKNMDKCRAKFNYKKIEKNSSGNNNKTEEITKMREVVMETVLSSPSTKSETYTMISLEIVVVVLLVVVLMLFAVLVGVLVLKGKRYGFADVDNAGVEGTVKEKKTGETPVL